jgi:16S rRNA (uracil1498-N3)-methyltransferase
MTLRRFYAPIENFKNETVSLDSEQTRHLRDVLRLRRTEQVQVFDGEGNEFSCEIETIEKKETLLKVIEKISPTAPESNLDLTLAIALLKGEKFDLVVQKATELGVTKLVPLNTKRADVKFAGAERKLERWRKIIVDATKQCGRAKLMQIEKPTEFEEFIKFSAIRQPGSENLVLFAERGGESFSTVKTNQQMIAVIGSEGGWEESEIEAARKNDFQIVTLNGRILRSETAAISIAAILQHRYGDLN